MKTALLTLLIATIAMIATSRAILIGSEVGNRPDQGASIYLACSYFNGAGTFTVLHRYSPVVQWGTTTTCPVLVKE